MNAPQPGLKIRRDQASNTHTLRLSGELDLTSAGILETSIAEICADGAVEVVLDMSELRFMDSTGLRSLLVSQEVCTVNGCAFSIGSLTPQVERLLELSGMEGRLRGDGVSVDGRSPDGGSADDASAGRASADGPPGGAAAEGS